MGLRFYRRFKILPGISLNLSRSGVSTSVGVRGAHVTVGHGKVRTTVGLPGSGLSYTNVENSANNALRAERAAETPTGKVWRGWLWITLLIVVLASVAYSVAKAAESSPAVPDVYAVKSPEPDQRGTAQQPLVIEQPADTEHARNERETTQSTIGLTILTGFLFLANLWLITEARRVSTRQADETKQSLEVQARSATAMRDVAEATKNNAVLMSAMFGKQMRAYLAVDIGTASYQDEHNIFEAIPVLTNFGLTPARNVSFRLMADILDGTASDFVAPPVGELLISDATMAPRQIRTIRTTIGRRVPEEDVVAIMQGRTRRLFGWGKVKYEDIFGDSHETNFCLNYYFYNEGEVTKVGGGYAARHNDIT